MKLPPMPPACIAPDPTAGAFLRVLLLELHKVSSFFVDKAQEVEVSACWLMLLRLVLLACLGYSCDCSCTRGQLNRMCAHSASLHAHSICWCVPAGSVMVLSCSVSAMSATSRPSTSAAASTSGPDETHQKPPETTSSSCTLAVVPQAALAGAALLEQSALASLQSEISELIKFVALNYLAVVKAIKKRNRHFKVRHM